MDNLSRLLIAGLDNQEVISEALFLEDLRFLAVLGKEELLHTLLDRLQLLNRLCLERRFELGWAPMLPLFSQNNGSSVAFLLLEWGLLGIRGRILGLRLWVSGRELGA